MTAGVLGLCLDLNVWCAAFLADRRGAVGTASQSLVGIARAGRQGSIPVRLIVSWGMPTRLRKVVELDWGVSRRTADSLINAIVGYARLGAAGAGPPLTLGGTGRIPVRDEEDAHVLDTALAARAHLLVTANFDDFVTSGSRLPESGKVAIHTAAAGQIVIAHPFRAVEWLRNGIFPDADGVAKALG